MIHLPSSEMIVKSEYSFQHRDAFYWYCRMDMASTVAALDSEIISKNQAKEIATGIKTLMDWGQDTDNHRPTDYLDIQALLFSNIGPIASAMHAGRSRQCMLATLHRLLLRDRLSILFHELLCLRSLFLERGLDFKSFAVPSYTNGVQAQPVLLGHLMCGYESPLSRTTDRYKEAYTRLNQSPLGSAALATSRFNIDRELIAMLLGFDTFVYNSFDATQLAVVDVGIECAHIASLFALSLNMFTQDIHAQFHHVRPWIKLSTPTLSSHSTLMPQKRNPVVLNRARLLGSQVVGTAQTANLAAHNVCSGYTDYKRMEASETLDLAINLCREVSTIISGMIVDGDAALEELRSEFTTTSELAASLHEHVDIPLSVAHEFASKLVDTARSNRFTLSSIPFELVTELFDETLSLRNIKTQHRFPLTPVEFQHVVDPISMIHNYKGKGGSSPKEVSHMLEVANRKLETDKAWLDNLNVALAKSSRQLDVRFNALIND